MDTKAKDEKYMRMALDEARKALAMQEVPIGAVVVAGDRIVGRGHNLVETLADSTAHAEMQALTAAMSTLGGKYLTDCTIYVTVEPCAMCAGAIVYARIKNVYFGATDLRFGCAGTVHNIACDPSLNHRAAVHGGILEPECRALLQAFFADKRKKK